MPRTRPPCPEAFREQIAALVHTGRCPQELKPSAQTIRNWIKQADREAGRPSDGLTTGEQQELTCLRRENEQLRLEREISSKAVAWFARETGALPKGASRS